MVTTPPILDFPGRGRAVIEPGQLLARGSRIPERVVLCFFKEVLRKYTRAGRLTEIHKLTGEGEPTSVLRWGRGARSVAVCWPGLGSPYAAAVLEQLIALGGRRFIACGSAGVLVSDIPAGRVVVPVAALRDEGTSYHYQPAGRLSRPHPAALEALRQACRARRVSSVEGVTWTTDAVFRETPRQVSRRRDQGCITVEMEAAAFFAVARFRRAMLGQVLYAGDDVGSTEWRSRGFLRLKRTREELFLLAIDACRRLED